MKKVFLITTLVCGMLTACSDNKNTKTETPSPEVTTVAPDSASSISTESAKAAEEKRIKDSADAAHGHTH